MSLYLKREVNSQITIGIWAITESISELAKCINLSDLELEELNKIKYESKKLQWLSLRALLNEILQVKADIKYTEKGKPYLEGHHLKISFSHTLKFAAVIVNKEKETGIDIEKINPKVERIKSKFLSEQELGDDKKEYVLEKLLVYWGAKEALYKLYGKKELAFKENILIDPFEFMDTGTIKGRITKGGFIKYFTLSYEKIQDYILVYVLEEINLHPEITIP